MADIPIDRFALSGTLVSQQIIQWHLVLSKKGWKTRLKSKIRIRIVYIYMGETRQVVRMLKKKKSGIFTLYTWRFLDHFHIFPFMKITMCFNNLEASHIMSWDS